jgi:hypothetical protein
MSNFYKNRVEWNGSGNLLLDIYVDEVLITGTVSGDIYLPPLNTQIGGSYSATASFIREGIDFVYPTQFTNRQIDIFVSSSDSSVNINNNGLSLLSYEPVGNFRVNRKGFNWLITSKDSPQSDLAINQIVKVGSNKLLGRFSPGIGVIQEVQLSGGLTFSSGVLSSQDTVYTHPTYTARSITATGAQVLSTFTSDAIGSVTNITTRTLTPANIGAAATGHTHSVSDITDSTTVGRNLVTLPNPGSITFLRVNANNTVSALATDEFRTAIGAQIAGSYLTANQTITLSGDLIGSGTTSISATIGNDKVTTAKIINDAVTNAKLANVAVNTIKGRITSGIGDPEDLTPTEVRTILGAGSANGLATLDSNGLVPSSQLPSYVDDVLEFTNLAGFPATGETGKIYVAQDTNKIYRWSGSAYIEISPVAGNADTATKLATARNISASGDATWTVSFDGSADVSSALTIGNDKITTAKILNSNVTYAKIQNVTTSRILGRVSANNGVLEELTAAQVRTLLNVADGAQANVDTNLTYTAATASGVVNSSTGTNATIPAATTSLAGLMTNTDKTKLDGIATSANNYTHPAYTARSITATGAQVLSTFTSDTIGSVTGITVRSLTPGDIGAATASHTHTISQISDSTTVGQRLVTLSNPGAITFLRVNVDNTVSALNAADFRTAINAQVAGSYLTGNQTITLSGDLSGSGTTSISATISNNAVTTAKILNSNVTYAKIQDVTSKRLLGRAATSNGVVGEISIGSNLTLSDAGVLTATNTVYAHPTGFTNQPATALSGANVISRVLVNDEGHVTGVDTRSLTAANIGAAATGHTHSIDDVTGLQSALNNKDNYVRWNITDANAGSGSIASNDTLTFLGSGATDVTYDPSTQKLTISSTDTTYSGSTSIVLSGNSFQRAALTGDVTANQNSNATTISNNAVTTAKILNANVTYAKIQDVTSSRILGRVSANNGVLEELTAAQVRTFLNVADGANNYTHPTQTAIDVNATDDGINVIDRVQVNTLGHVTSVSTRNLSEATTSAAGVMSSADKTKLDGIAANANNYTHPTGGANTTITNANGLVLSSITVNSLGHVTAVGSKTLAAADIPNLDAGKITSGTLPVGRGGTGATSLTSGSILVGGGTNAISAAYTVETTLTGGTSAIPRADAVKAYVDSLLASNDAMIFKGTLGTGGTYTSLPTTHGVGWTIKVITAGTYAGKVAEIGDMYVSLVTRSGSGNTNADWAVIQTNIDGAVVGPASAVSGRIATFNGTTGKLIQDSGFTIATSVPPSAVFTDTNNYLSGVSGSGNGTVTFTRLGLTDLTWNSSHTHTAAQISNSTTVGQNLITLTNPNAITFLRVNVDNTVSALAADEFRTAIGAGTGSSNLTLGETSATAYRGDRGKIAYDHSQLTTGSIHGSTTVGIALFRIGDNATTNKFIRVNADNTLSYRTGAEVRDDIGAAATNHTHGNITNGGAIGSTSDLVVVTGASGVLTTQSRSGIDSRTSFPPSAHSITTHSATAWRMFFSNATTSSIQELVFGAAGTYLRSGGVSANPTWATIAYSEISGTPTIGNGTLTLATSGIASGSATFTANQSGGSTFTVTVPGTNLSIGSSTSTEVRVDSSTGNNATLPLATASLAGILSATTQTIGGEKTFTNKLTVSGSTAGQVVLDIQGTSGQLFSITDSLVGLLFSVNDISGIPVFETYSDGTVNIGTFGSPEVVVTSGAVALSGTATAPTPSTAANNTQIATTAFVKAQGYVTSSGVTSVSSGNGMNFTNFTTTGTITLGTPSNITLSSSNSVTTNSHTHAFVPGGTTAQYIRGDGSLATFPSIPSVGNGTLTLATSGIATGSATFTANQSDGSTFTVNVPGTNIAQGTRTATTVPITSSTGTNATLDVATTSLAGVMSSADKTKLDGIAANANNYTHPTQTAIDVNATDNGINVIDRVVVNTLGHVTSVSTRNLSEATISAAGVMSAADKTKLDGIAANATSNTGTVTSVAPGTQISGMSMTISNQTTTPSIATSITNAANFRSAIGAQAAGSYDNYGGWSVADGNGVGQFDVLSGQKVLFKSGSNVTIGFDPANNMISIAATDTNNFLSGVSGSGNGTVTFTRSGLSNLTWNAAHTHTPSQVGLGNVTNDAQVTTTNNQSLNTDNRNRRGVTRLYRRDDDSDYSVQTYWTGTYWRLYGYNGDSDHADTHVGYADSSGFATSAGSTSQSVTFNNGGAGAGSGTTFNGSIARTISYNTIGAPSTTGTNASGTWGINITGNSATVTNGVYTTGNQDIAGIKNFTAGILRATRSAASASHIALEANSGFTQMISSASPGSGTAVEYRFLMGTTRRLTISTNGGMRLGVNSPTNTAGRFEAENDIVAFASDRRLKTNVSIIENALDKVKLLSGITYEWNEKAKEVAGFENDRRLVGVYAQELQSVLPEAVQLAPFDSEGGVSKSGENYLTVQYEKIVPLLIEAIKEQQREIEDLKKLIK